jgi:DnaJ like chaperone protein
MANGWAKWLWGGLGWALGGPIGAIMGFALGAINEQQQAAPDISSRRTLPGDFGSALLILCAALMKADKQLMKSELEYVRQFFNRQFGPEYTRERMLLFREIIKQDIELQPVCMQIRQHVNYSSRLELIHLLFGLAGADKKIDVSETELLRQIAVYLDIKTADYESIKAMFVKDENALYKILEVTPSASDDELKRAFRSMALKYHPDKVHHLGPEFQKDAQEKFRKISEAYEELKKIRNIR